VKKRYEKIDDDNATKQKYEVKTMSTIRSFSLMVLLLCGACSAWGGGDVIDCSVCLDELRIQPPDPEKPFVLLHGDFKRLHAVCLDCAHGLNERVDLWHRPQCPLCREQLGYDFRRRLALGSRNLHDENVRLATDRMREWHNASPNSRADFNPCGGGAGDADEVDDDGVNNDKGSYSGSLNSFIERNPVVLSVGAAGVVAACGFVAWYLIHKKDEKKTANGARKKRQKTSFIARMKERVNDFLLL